MILSIYLFWIFLLILPSFILVMIFLFRKLETRRTLKIGVGLSLISSYGFTMATLATTAAFMINIIPGIPPQIQITNLNGYCRQSSFNCIKISNTFAIDLASIYIILFTIGITILLYLLIQLTLGISISRKIRKERNPILSEYWNTYFSKITGLPLNNIKIEVINSGKIEAYSFTLLPLRKTNSKNSFIVISTGLLKSISDKEISTVIAHEYGHIYLQDTIWIPFLKLLNSSKIYPLNIVTKKIKKYVEIRADELSAQWTRLPGHLASALLKVYEKSLITTSNKIAVSFSSQEEKVLIQRIERLLQMDLDLLPFKWPKW